MYVCVYFFQNLYEINDIVRSLGVIDLIGLIAISALIHLLILPLRMWVLIRNMVVNEYTFFNYTYTYCSTFLLSITPLGLLGSDAGRYYSINWKIENSELKKMSMIFLDRLSGFLVILFFVPVCTKTFFTLMRIHLPFFAFFTAGH